MSHRKAPAPLTPASERRLSLRARSLLDTAARRSYLDKHIITIAAGLLLRVASHTGETAARLMSRLHITESRRYLIVRCGQQEECARGDVPPPVIKRFLEINKTKPACILGRQCGCSQQTMRVRCGNWQRVDPTAGELEHGGRGALGARPVHTKEKRSCVRGDECTCKTLRDNRRCGNWRRGDPSARDFPLDRRRGFAPGAPWFGDDHAQP